MKENNVKIIECHEAGSIVHLAVDGKYKGHIHIGDQIKATSKQSINELKSIGIKKTIMLTGDDEKIGKDVASKIGIDEVYTNLLPQDKVSIIKKLLDKNNVWTTS